MWNFNEASRQPRSIAWKTLVFVKLIEWINCVYLQNNDFKYVVFAILHTAMVFAFIHGKYQHDISDATAHSEVTSSTINCHKFFVPAACQIYKLSIKVFRTDDVGLPFQLFNYLMWRDQSHLHTKWRSHRLVLDRKFALQSVDNFTVLGSVPCKGEIQHLTQFCVYVLRIIPMKLASSLLPSRKVYASQ